jgi:hypothetical protein
MIAAWLLPSISDGKSLNAEDGCRQAPSISDGNGTALPESEENELLDIAERQAESFR